MTSPPGDAADAVAIREVAGLADPLSDGRAEPVLADAVADAAAGDPDAAADALADAFPTPCRAHDPELRDVDGSRVACHLFDERYDDGTVEKPAPDTAAGRSDD